MACAPALLLVAVSVAACGQHDHTHALPWRAADLPVPTGWRAAPRSATWCAGHWVVVGFTANAAGLTRAAAWTSQDDGGWWPITLHPGRDYYSFRANLSSVGCSRGRLAVLGGKAGGFHGGLRTRAWKQLPDGSLAALHGSRMQLGGAQGVAVSQVVGGPGGYLLAGGRFSGAAVWTSRRGGYFRLHEGEPGLADSRVTQTLATDAAPDADHWVVV